MVEIVGIDLGTTNSEIAVYTQGGAQVLADQNGRKILPSVVGISPEGEVLVGEEARNQLLLHPDRTVRSVKRLMGSDTRIKLGDQEYSPQEVSAIILRRLKATAEASLGHSVTKAVITVPAYFSDAQRQATREAGEIAGLEVVRIINEPTAAALTYEAGQHQGKRILVYDLGGGTFDVSVVRIEDGVVEVISTHGNNHLGGDDFDRKIVTHILEHLQMKHAVDLSGNAHAMARIQRSAEAATRHLSDHPYVMIEEEYLGEHQGRPVHMSLELERPTYEEMIRPFVEETLEAIHVALKGAGLTASQVEEVLLVGGATRTPMIRQRLQEVFGRDPRAEVDPDLCVAVGAAIQGAMIDGQDVSAVLVDVTPYTFGTSAIGELNGEYYPYKFIPIIPKNTPIPVHRSEVFYTVHDNQTEVDIKVYQGEYEDAMENVKIGEFRVEGLSHASAGNPVILDLALDRDGILRVTAREKNTGLERQITIDNAMSRYGEGDMAKARGRIDALFEEQDGQNEQGGDLVGGDLVGGDLVGSEAEVARLLTRATTALEKVVPEDRDELIDLIEAIRDAVSASNVAALDKATQALKDLLFYLEV